jgi:primosomal replication protein N
LSVNRVQLQATLQGREALRFSPAGIPLMNAVLGHASEQQEAGTRRRVELEIPAIFAGALAESAGKLEPGCALRVTGFLAPRRRQSKVLVLHVTEFDLIEV